MQYTLWTQHRGEGGSKICQPTPQSSRSEGQKWRDKQEGWGSQQGAGHQKGWGQWGKGLIYEGRRRGSMDGTDQWLFNLRIFFFNFI